MPLLSQTTVNSMKPLHQKVYDYVVNTLGNGFFQMNYQSTDVYVNFGDVLGGTATDTQLPGYNLLTGDLPKPNDCYFWFDDEITRIQNFNTNLLKITNVLDGAIIDISTDDIQLMNVVYTSVQDFMDDILQNFMGRIYPEADRFGARVQCVLGIPGFLNTGVGAVDKYTGGKQFPVFAKSNLNRSEVLDIKVVCNQLMGYVQSTDDVIANLPNISGSANVGIGGGETSGLIPIPKIQTGTTGLLELINRLYVAQNNNFYTVIKRVNDTNNRITKILTQANRILGNLKAFHDSENNTLYEIKVRLIDNSDAQDSYHESENNALYEAQINIQNIKSYVETIYDQINQLQNFINLSNQNIYQNLQEIASNMINGDSLQQALQNLEDSNDARYRDLVDRLNVIQNQIDTLPRQ